MIRQARAPSREVLRASAGRTRLELDWTSLMERLHGAARPPLEALAAHAEALALEDEVALATVESALETLGSFRRDGYRATAHEVIARGEVIAEHRKLVHRWLAELTEAGLLAFELGATYRRTELFGQLRPEAARARGWSGGGHRGDATLLASIVTGRTHPLELVFPGGDLRQARAFHENVAARFVNDLTATAVAVIAEHATDGGLRVLELGAGTGSLTAVLLPALRDDAVYAFTDLSPHFLSDAERRFGGHPAFSSDLFDMNQPAAVAGWEPCSVDVVVAFDVVHCAARLGHTLRELIDLLVPGGVLLLSERTAHRPAHLVVPGIVPGFDDYDDDRLIANHPLVGVEDWKRRLLAAGAASAGEALTLAHPGLEYHLIAARRPL